MTKLTVGDTISWPNYRGKVVSHDLYGRYLVRASYLGELLLSGSPPLSGPPTSEHFVVDSDDSERYVDSIRSINEMRWFSELVEQLELELPNHLFPVFLIITNLSGCSARRIGHAQSHNQAIDLAMQHNLDYVHPWSIWPEAMRVGSFCWKGNERRSDAPCTS